MKGKCRHCGKYGELRRRGLCSADYYQPDIRKLYPSKSKFGQWAGTKPDVNGRVAKPEREVEALPGSDEKIRILQDRAGKKEELHHRLDGIFSPIEKWCNALHQPSLAAKITTLRKRHNWTIRDLTRRSGVSKRNLCYLISGKEQKPTLTTIRKLAAAFGVGLLVLLGESDQANEKVGNRG